MQRGLTFRCHISKIVLLFPDLLSCFRIYCCDFGLIVTFLIFALMVEVGNVIKINIWRSNQLLPVIFCNCNKNTNNTCDISESILWCNLSWYCYHIIILPRPGLPYSKPLLCLACGSELKCFQVCRGGDTHNTNGRAAKTPNWGWVTGLAEQFSVCRWTTTHDLAFKNTFISLIHIFVEWTICLYRIHKYPT